MLSRLTQLHIHLIGAVVSIIVGVLLFFMLIRPQQDTLKKTQAETEDFLTTQHGNEDVQHKKDLDKKLQEVVQVNEQWQEMSSYYMPILPFKPDLLDTFPLISALPDKFSLYVRDWYNVQKPLGIAPGDTSFAIPDFPSDPNFVSSIQNLTFPEPGRPWQVTVKCASFDALMEHLRRFNTLQAHGMPVISNVSLSGQSSEDRPDSQDLYASYDLSLYCILSQTPPAKNDRIGVTGGGGGLGGLLGGKLGGGRGGGGLLGGTGGPGGGGLAGGGKRMMSPAAGGGGAH
jgi:hypothetical protein